MKYKIFIDSSEDLIVGLLDEQFNWICYRDDIIGKSSQFIHGLIHEIIDNNKISYNNVDSIIICSGPGSYTGLRLAEGISHIFKFKNISTKYFYHFEIPSLNGIDSGIWASNAFKGEIFVFKWDTNSHEKFLLNKNTFIDNDYNCNIYSLKESIENKKSFSTIDMIKKNPNKILKNICQKNVKYTPFYYRSITEEFKL